MEKYISKKEKVSYGFAAVGSYMVAGITQSYLMYFFYRHTYNSVGFRYDAYDSRKGLGCLKRPYAGCNSRQNKHEIR